MPKLCLLPYIPTLGRTGSPKGAPYLVLHVGELQSPRAPTQAFLARPSEVAYRWSPWEPFHCPVKATPQSTLPVCTLPGVPSGPLECRGSAGDLRS